MTHVSFLRMPEKRWHLFVHLSRVLIQASWRGFIEVILAAMQPRIYEV
jgi:hypothetical protein